MAINNTSFQTNPLLKTKTNTPGISLVGMSNPTTKAQSTPASQTTVTNPSMINSSNRQTLTQTSVGLETPAQTLARAQQMLNNTASQVSDSPTIAESLGTYTAPSYEQGKTYEELFPTINEEDIQRNQMKLFQAEIDSTNRIYDDMLAQERLRGMGRLGTQRAISARSGLLGSDFGEAQRSNVEAANTQAESAVQAERQAKIGAIMGTMRNAVSNEIAAKRAARKEDADTYISYLAGAKERRQNNANLAASAILAAGLDPATMQSGELDAIAKEAGLKTQDIILAYNTAKAGIASEELKTSKTQAEIDKLKADAESAGFFNLSEGQARYDRNGNLIASRAKTYAPSSGGGSSVRLTPDDKRVLLGGGYSESDISILEEGVRSQGLQSIIAQERAAGATASQIKALEKAYGATADTEQFLNKEYFRSLFGEDKLKEAAKEAGTVTGGNDWIPFNESGDTEAYLSSLEQTVNLYRQAGYTDQEILKMMQ